MKSIRKIFLIILMATVVSSCDLNKLDNPSAVTPSQADLDFILNGIQLSFAEFFYQASDFGMQMTRLTHFYGPTYENGYTANSFDAVWTSAYSDLMVNAQANLASFEEKQLFYHAGMAQVLQAYTMMTLIDFFGAVPYSEAFDPSNLNPAQDNQATMYTEAVSILDAAIVNFGKTSLAKPKNDLYYAGNQTRWITLAKTLKLRAHLQTRLVDTSAQSKIEALVTGGDLLDVESEDFNFRYSTTNANPDSRHPYFIGNYLSGGNTYQTNYLMYAMYLEKTVVDPRIRYYFYRQVSQTTTDVNELFCINTTAPSHYAGQPWSFCAVGDGYWGRDFADFTGIPPDNFERTNFGVYPAGGRFDNNSFASVTVNDGLKGAGILPIMNSAFTDFMRAEAALVFNSATIGSPVILLEAGVRKSIDKAKGFGAIDAGTSGFIPSPTVITTYVNEVLSLYAAATNNNGRMEVIIKEYWIALFGNGIDAFNAYRRTGKPGTLQLPLSPNGGNPYRSFTYPSVYVTRNSTVTQKPDNKVKVFWDTNPDGFIK